MSESRTISISRSLFTVLCAATIVTLAALIICIVKQSERRDYVSDLDEVIAKGDLGLIQVIDGFGKTQVYSPNGSKVKPCGRVVGSKIEGECKLSGKITNFGAFSYAVQVGSPPCTTGYDSEGNVYEVHASSDTRSPKRWRAGQIGCHAASAGAHSWP